MKLAYDPIHVLLNREFLPEVAIAKSVEFDGVIIDYAEDRRTVAIEMLDASKRTTQVPLDLINVALGWETVSK